MEQKQDRAIGVWREGSFVLHSVVRRPAHRKDYCIPGPEAGHMKKQGSGGLNLGGGEKGQLCFFFFFKENIYLFDCTRSLVVA